MSGEDDVVIWNYIIHRDLVIQYLFCLCCCRKTVVLASNLNFFPAVYEDEALRLKKAYALSLCVLLVASTAA